MYGKQASLLKLLVKIFSSVHIDNTIWNILVIAIAIAIAITAMLDSCVLYLHLINIATSTYPSLNHYAQPNPKWIDAFLEVLLFSIPTWTWQNATPRKDFNDNGYDQDGHCHGSNSNQTFYWWALMI